MTGHFRSLINLSSLQAIRWLHQAQMDWSCGHWCWVIIVPTFQVCSWIWYDTRSPRCHLPPRASAWKRSAGRDISRKRKTSRVSKIGRKNLARCAQGSGRRKGKRPNQKHTSRPWYRVPGNVHIVLAASLSANSKSHSSAYTDPEVGAHRCHAAHSTQLCWRKSRMQFLHYSEKEGRQRWNSSLGRSRCSGHSENMLGELFLGSEDPVHS